MKKNRYLWLLIGIVSIFLGISLAMLQLAFCSYSELSDYELPSLLLRFLVFTAVCFFILGLFVLFFAFFSRFFRWLFSWRIIKRCLIALACLAALIALFYIEEDWRGKRAWENYKHEWEAKGEKFDFASFIPVPVPDDQNFALTPIVASCYSCVLDKNGHRIQPENTNVVNRLKMDIYRASLAYRIDPFTETNLELKGWRKNRLTDLSAWQTYYRTMFITNRWEGPRAKIPPSPRAGTVVSLESNSLETVIIDYVDALATNEFPVASQSQSAAADVLLALSKYDSVVEELRQASRLSHSRFPLNYDQPLPFGIQLPHLGSLKSCAQVLQLRAIAELGNQQTSKALDDMKLIAYLANSIHGEQCLISQKVRAAILDLAIQPIWEGCVEHRWSDDQLSEINRQLAGLDLLSDYDSAVRGERAMALKLIDHERRTHNADIVANQWGYKDDELDFMQHLVLFYYHSFPNGWYYQNEITAARAFQESLWTGGEVNQLIPPHNVIWRIGYAWNTIMIHYHSPYYFFVRESFPDLRGAAKKITFTQASVDMARTACALERYRLAHGEYPEKLDALVPQFIERLPNDIINGQPLHYHRTADGQFVLYSVGWNEKDDGGVSVFRFSFGEPDIGSAGGKGDWVWQYPVK
jgi:hypothetical protein